MYNLSRRNRKKEQLKVDQSEPPTTMQSFFASLASRAKTFLSISKGRRQQQVRAGRK
jgi:hypothetical protein